jgi:hypothetical protein
MGGGQLKSLEISWVINVELLMIKWDLGREPGALLPRPHLTAKTRRYVKVLTWNVAWPGEEVFVRKERLITLAGGSKCPTSL